LKSLIFIILLATSSTLGLLETLYHVENDCYSGCHSNYADSLSNREACKNGCDYKLHNENCPDQCKLLSTDEQSQASCLVGCSMNHMQSIQSIENERPRSIILIRLRQRPLFNTNPVQIFNNMIKQFKENPNVIEQSSDVSKYNELKNILQVAKNLPLIKIPNTNSLNEDNTNEVKHFIIHQEIELSPLQQFIENIRNKWNRLVCNHPKLPLWIFLSILISTSAILLHKIISLCWTTPNHRNLSVRSEEIIFEKEINQLLESVPIKIKLPDN